MKHTSYRLTRAVVLVVFVLAAPTAGAAAGPDVATVWQELVGWWQGMFVVETSAPVSAAAEGEAGPTIDPNGLQQDDPPPGADGGPNIDPHGLQQEQCPAESDAGPTIDPCG